MSVAFHWNKSINVSQMLKMSMSMRQKAKLVVYSRRLDPLLRTLRALRVKKSAVMPKLRLQSPMNNDRSCPTMLIRPNSPAIIPKTVMSTLMTSFIVFLRVLW